MAWTFKAPVTASNSGSAKTNYSHEIVLSPASTTVTGTEAAGQTVITLGDTTGMSANDWLIFDTGGGAEEWKQIQTVDSGTQVTLTAGLDNEQASTNCDNADQHIVDNTQSTGADLRVTPSGDLSTLLDHFIANWDGTDGYILYVEIPSIGGSGSTTVDVHYGGGAVSSTSNVEATFLGGIDFTDVSKLESDVLDAGEVELFDYKGITANPIVQLSDVTGSTAFREQGPVLHDPNDPNLGGNPEREYKLYFTVVPAAGNDQLWVAMSATAAFSTVTYTQCTGIAQDVQDPGVTCLLNTPGQVYRDGSDNMYMYMEDNGDDEINLYTSTNGIAWTLDTNGVIGKGGSSTWDEGLVGSPVPVHDGTNFIVGYEGRQVSPQRDAFGMATGTSGNSLTKSGNNPLFEPTDHSGFPTNGSVVVDDFFKSGTKIYFVGHSGQSADDVRYFRAESSEDDPTQWADGDIVQLGGDLDKEVRNDLTMHYGVTDYSQIVTTNLADDEIVFLRVTGDNGGGWKISRVNDSESTQDEANWEESDVYVDSNKNLVLEVKDPASGGTGDFDFGVAMFQTGNIGVASGFEIVGLIKQVAQTDDEWSALFFGSGAFGMTTQSGADTGFVPSVASGYLASFKRPTNATGLEIREFDASRVLTATHGGGNLAVADTQAFKIRRFSYLSSGALSASVGGSSTTATDSTHTSGNKRIGIAQGQRGDQDVGGVTHAKFLAARVYDGTDTTNAIGQPESENVATLPEAPAASGDQRQDGRMMLDSRKLGRAVVNI